MKKSKLKPIRAWAIVNREKEKLNVFDIYHDKKDVVLIKGERFVRVEITEVA